MPRFNRGRNENGGKGRGREKEGKENVEGMTEGRGGRKVWGIRLRGNCATAPRGDRRHCTRSTYASDAGDDSRSWASGANSGYLQGRLLHINDGANAPWKK